MNAGTAAVLERVREYRRAARVAVRADEHRLQDRYLVLLDLAECARAEPDLLVRRWAELAIWDESRVFLGVEDEQPQTPPEPFERAQRRLRIEGYATCPKCLSTLASDVDFDRWRQMRAAHIAELEARERVER